MPPRIRALKAALRSAGFRERQGKGSHTVWEHAVLPTEKLTISGSDNDDVKRYQESDVRVILEHLREALRDRP